VKPDSVADASKERKGRKEALALAHAAEKVVVAKGKKFVTFDMKKDPPNDAALAAHLLGPTGNLRAPTIRLGPSLLVGFNEDVYRDWLGNKK
jgi:arsenate reductase-like glutaredoxin family protein